MPQPERPAAFVVKPDRMDTFLALAQEDASRSLADEPGCRRFDVVRMGRTPPHVLFHEACDSRAAFEAHLQTRPPARFREGFPALVPEKRPVRCASRHHG